MLTKPALCSAFAFVWDTVTDFLLQRKRTRLSSPSRSGSMDRGVEQLVARRAHNPKVAGSSPATATRPEIGQAFIERVSMVAGPFLCLMGTHE